MDKFQKLDCVKGLLMGMDRQLDDLYKKEGDATIVKKLRDIIVNKYYESIKDFLNKDECGKGSGWKKIIVNGTNTSVLNNSVTYEGIVQLAGFDKTTKLTVTFSSKNYEGTLCEGQQTAIEHDMIFNVADTSEA